MRELETVDRELEAIDEELAASAITAPPSVAEAIAAVTARIASLERTAPDMLFADTPPQLVRLANTYMEARAEDVRLGIELGERNPDRLEQRRVIAVLRAGFDRQREVELAEANAWKGELAKLARIKATPAKLRQANRRALQVTLAQFSADAMAPSDAPAEVRVAAARVLEALRQIELAAQSLGPKHPKMIALRAELAAGREAFRTALDAADLALLHELAALEAPRGRPEVNSARLARRAELAARSRDLRLEWDALK